MTCLAVIQRGLLEGWLAVPLVPRNPESVGDAIGIILDWRGTKFDSVVVDALSTASFGSGPG